MSFELAGKGYSRAVATLPYWGVWSARVTLAEPSELPLGTRVKLTVGDLSAPCTIRSGGTFAGVSRYLVVGGADGWAHLVKGERYRSDSGIRVAQAAADLAGAAGEQLVLEAGVDRALGYAWTRPAGLPSSALDELEARWWVDPLTGVTHLGPRPAAPVTARLAIADWDPGAQRALVASPDDAVAALLPGAVIAQDGVALAVRSTTLWASPDAIEVEIEGIDTAELLRGIVAKLTRRRLFDGLYTYRVDQQAADRVTLQSVGAVAGLPDLLWIDQAHGIPGATHVLAPSSIVLIGFEGGDPGAPIVLHYLAAPNPLPVSVALDAQDELRLGGASAELLSRSDRTDAAIEQLRIAGNIVRASLALPNIGPIPTTASDKVKGE